MATRRTANRNSETDHDVEARRIGRPVPGRGRQPGRISLGVAGEGMEEGKAQAGNEVADEQAHHDDGEEHGHHDGGDPVGLG